MDIEKNDVDLSKLFTWSKEVPIYDTKGELMTRVFIRTIGDADINKARVFALRESSKLRKALRNKGTDEYEAFIGGLDLQNKETLSKSIILLLIQPSPTNKPIT